MTLRSGCESSSGIFAVFWWGGLGCSASSTTAPGIGGFEASGLEIKLVAGSGLAELKSRCELFWRLKSSFAGPFSGRKAGSKASYLGVFLAALRKCAFHRPGTSILMKKKARFQSQALV